MVRGIDNVGVGAVYASFSIAAEEGVPLLTEENIGQAVTLTDNHQIGLGNEGDRLLGELCTVQSDIGVVQVKGVVRLPRGGTSAPTPGGKVVVDGTGKVQVSATGEGQILAVTSSFVDVLL